MKRIEKEFEQIAAFIRARRNGAIGFSNYAAVSTYWTVGAYISTRVKSKTWDMGSVLALCDYLKTRHPKIRGFGQRQIYNMVEFYDTFSSAEFDQIHSRLMKEFILELGKDYLYMGDEYHVQVGGNDKRLDLLFFHRGLQCLVDVELKAVPFEPEFISKMDVYLEALDRDVRRPYENPSVGLLLCPSADKCEVEYALNRTMSPTMVAEYQRLLIPKEVMRKTLEEYCLFLKHDMAKG